MVITYYGITCFKIQSGNTVLAVDPYAKESGLTPPRFQADIVLSTRNHPLHGNTESITGNPFVITSPGEYETKGVFIEGIPVEDRTLYLIEWEGVRLCHMGTLLQKQLTDDIRERMGVLDILFLPVGGNDSLDAEEAVQVMNSTEPRIVIPMYFACSGFTALPLHKVDLFFKEIGSSPAQEEKLTIKKKDVPQEKTTIVFLNPIAGS